MKKLILVFALLISIAIPCYADENRYDFSFPIGTKLETVLYSIAHRDGREIILNVDSNKPVNVIMDLKNKTVDEALNLLSIAYDFNWKIEDNAIVVTPATSNSTLQKSFELHYATAKYIKEDLLTFMPESKIRINPEYNTITVDGTPAVISKVSDFIAQKDVPVKQIMIIMQMIQVNRSDALKLGFQYTLPNYDNSTTPFRAQFTVTSAADQTMNKGKILARPAITTFNGQQASILIGGQLPVITKSTDSSGDKSSSVTFQDVGTKIIVTPYVNDAEKKIIALDLEPTYSSLEKWVTSGDTTAPQISTRTAKTKVRVHSGDNIVIGGLMSESDLNNMESIPLLSKIPMLGKIFTYRDKSKEHSEFFFVVTPILLDDDMTMQQAQDLIRGEQKKEEKAPVSTPTSAHPEKTKIAVTDTAPAVAPAAPPKLPAAITA